MSSIPVLVVHCLGESTLFHKYIGGVLERRQIPLTKGAHIGGLPIAAVTKGATCGTNCARKFAKVKIYKIRNW